MIVISCTQLYMHVEKKIPFFLKSAVKHGLFLYWKSDDCSVQVRQRAREVAGDLLL